MMSFKTATAVKPAPDATSLFALEHRYIHLENDVLFPGAIRLEESRVTERP
jgi:hypothetical protein